MSIFPIDPEALPEEQLTHEEVQSRFEEHKPFRTAQDWGAPLGSFAYLYGSTALVNDDDQPRALAVAQVSSNADDLEYLDVTLRPLMPHVNLPFVSYRILGGERP